MHFAVYCRDVAGSGQARSRSIAEHRRYVDDRADMIVLSGPLVSGDGVRRGQLFVLDAPDRAAAEEFVAGDPFTRAGVFASVEIERLLLRFSGGERWQDV